MVTGTVLCFGVRGFGFAETDGGHLNVFVHIADVKGSRFLHAGDRIRFNVVPSAKHPGKLDGKNVEFIESTPDGGGQ